MQRVGSFSLWLLFGLHGACAAATGPQLEYLPSKSVHIDTAFTYKRHNNDGILYVAIRMPAFWANTHIRCRVSLNGRTIQAMNEHVSITQTVSYIFKKIIVDMKPLMTQIERIQYDIPFKIQCRSGQVISAPWIQLLTYVSEPSIFVQDVERDETGKIKGVILKTVPAPSYHKARPRPAIQPTPRSAPDTWPYYTCAFYEGGGLIAIAEAFARPDAPDGNTFGIPLDEAIFRFDGVQCQRGGFAKNRDSDR